MGDVNLEIKLNNLDDRVIKIEESGGGSGGDGYITSVSNDFNVVNKKLLLSNDVTTKLSKLNSDGTLDFSNVESKPTTLSGYGITDAYTKSNTYSKTEVDNKLDSWIDYPSNPVTSTGEQDIIFTGLDTTKAYKLFFETTNGSQVSVKSSSLSGTTMTYVINIPTDCPIPVNFKLRVIK